MSERVPLMVFLTALDPGSRIPTYIGESAFHGLLIAGWAVVILWTAIAWRRGERAFIWQDRQS